MKLLETVTMKVVKEHWQVWSINFLMRKQDRE